MSLKFMYANHIASQGGQGSNLGGFEPQRQNNNIITFHGLADDQLLVLALESFPLPKTANEVVESHYLNEVRKVAGKATFEDIAVVYKDFVDMTVADVLHNWRYQVYNPETGKVGLARDYKKRGTLEQVDPSGNHSRKYELVGCWISAFDPGDADMASGDTVKITATITLDKCYPLFGQEIIKNNIKTEAS